MKVTARDLKIIKSLKPSTHQYLPLFAVSFTSDNGNSMTAHVAGADEGVAVTRVRETYEVERVSSVLSLGFVSVPA